jgi:uncharacterized protein
MNENRDPEHGKRGAEYARKLRSDIIDLTDDQFEILFFACEWHTKGKHTDPPSLKAMARQAYTEGQQRATISYF